MKIPVGDLYLRKKFINYKNWKITKWFNI